MATLATFLIVTQPGLQSGVLRIATGLTTLFGAGAKLREVVAPWFTRQKNT